MYNNNSRSISFEFANSGTGPNTQYYEPSKGRVIYAGERESEGHLPLPENCLAAAHIESASWSY